MVNMTFAAVGSRIAESVPEAESQAEMIITEYAGTKIPLSTILGYGAVLILLIGVAVAAIILLRNHVRNWASAIFPGLVFCMVFGYVLPELVEFIMTQIPAVARWGFFQPYDGIDKVNWHRTATKAILVGIRPVCDALAVFLSVVYYMRSARRQEQHVVAGNVLAIGIAFYLVIVVLGDPCSRFFHTFDSSAAGSPLSSFYQGIQYGNVINQNSFELVLTELVNGLLQEEGFTATKEIATAAATESILNISMSGIFVSLTEFLVLLVRGITYTIAAVFFYGVHSGKLTKKWIFAAIACLLFFWAPFFAGLYVEIPVWGAALYFAALGFAEVFCCIKTLQARMPGDLMAFNYSRKAEIKKQEEKKNKMPKIVMPKD